MNLLAEEDQVILHRKPRFCSTLLNIGVFYYFQKVIFGVFFKLC